MKRFSWLVHLVLFVITFITTLFAGTFWTTGRMGPYDISFLQNGLIYSIAILFIITCHEFGHYFAARFHKVDATLPYYIPFPPLAEFLNFGTMGAVIKTKSPIYTRKAMFDIGASGPIAGFVACLIVLIYGFTHLPPESYLLAIHPDFHSSTYGKGGIELIFGDNLLIEFFKHLFVTSKDFFPPMSEIYHYPYLCVGWFGLFITAMNMIPVGQLDGGHIAYTVFGSKLHNKISYTSIVALVLLGLSGILTLFMNFKLPFGWTGWLLWAVILFFLIKPKHPPIPDYSELDLKRKIIGYITFAIFIVSFSPSPFIINGGF